MPISLQYRAGDRQGRSFYRLMALIGLITSVFFGLVFIQILDHIYEPVWDRAAMALISLAVYVYTGRKSTSNKRVYQVCNGLFYLYTLHIIWTCYNNQFHWTYVLSLIVTLQSVTISFRDEWQAGKYTIVVIVCLLLTVLGSTAISMEARLSVLLALIVSSVLLYLVVRIRSRFYYKMRAQQDVLKSIVTSSENGILILNMKGFVTDANSQACELLGCDFSGLKGADFSEFRVNPLSPQESADLLGKMHHETTVFSEFQMKRNDGSVFDAYVTMSLIRQTGNAFLVYRVKDWSERMAFQQSLIEAKENAEHAAELKTQFLATVSHEIRTPLNGIMGMTELVLGTELNPEQSEYLEQIKASNNHLLFIVNDILDFSKIEDGKMELSHEALDLRATVEQAVKTFSGSVRTKKLAYHLEYDSHLPTNVTGDAHRIQQILLNLLGNAVKFTEQGSVTLKVSKGEGDRVQFAVTDTGIGIPEHKIDSLFQAFSQVDASHSRKFGGTGLGLAICYRLAELMDGSLGVESTLGEGSTFFLEIPLKSTSQQLEVAGDLPHHNDSETLVLPQNLRVMLAEDNAINQHVAKLILGQMGIDADVAENGVEVLEKLRTTAYDIIFMDLQMPEMDGLEATRKILDPNGEFERKPVIVAMTANAMPQDIALCESVGMKGFVSKPINLAELRKALEQSIELLGRRA